MPRAKYTYTSAKERAEKKTSEFQSSCLKLPKDVKMFQPKEGTMLLDILPFVAGEGNPWAEEGNLHWERQYYVHRGIGANSEWYVCPRMTSKQRCPICEFRKKLMEGGDEDNEKAIADLAPKQRQLFNVIDLRNPDKGVQIWDASYHLFGKLLDERIRTADEEDDWEKFFFLEGGLVLKVAFSEESFGSFKYLDAVSIDFKPRKEDYDEEILEKVHCLDELLVEVDYDKLKKVFLEAKQEDDDEPEDDDEEETPKKKHKPESKRPADDDDESDDEPDDDEEEAPPAKKKKKAPADDDDWSDFDDDDDEEETPKKKKKPAEDDEEDEPDDDDEELEDEEEEPPKKKKKRPEPEDDDEEEERPKRKVDNDDDDDGWADPKETEKELARRKKKKAAEDDDE